MSHQNIIQAVENSIEVLCNDFEVHPTFFFTENDIVCYFYNILQQKLPVYRAFDKESSEHLLVHMEYPTPFRCDMSKNKFERKDDEARTNGGKYRRGHYDIVVLNPDFIAQQSYEVIKSQNYELYKNQVISKIDRKTPIILYCIEFMYKAKMLTFVKGSSKEIRSLLGEKLSERNEIILCFGD